MTINTRRLWYVTADKKGNVSGLIMQSPRRPTDPLAFLRDGNLRVVRFSGLLASIFSVPSGRSEEGLTTDTLARLDGLFRTLYGSNSRVACENKQAGRKSTEGKKIHQNYWNGPLQLVLLIVLQLVLRGRPHQKTVRMLRPLIDWPVCESNRRIVTQTYRKISAKNVQSSDVENK